MSEHTFDATELMDQVTSASMIGEGIQFARLGVLAALDSTDGYRRDGFTSTANFLIGRCGLGVNEAQREVFLARSLPHMPYAAKLVGAGRLTLNQFEAFAHARRRHPDQYEEDEPTLAESADGLDLADTRRLIDYWCQAHCDPEDVEPSDPSRVYLSKTMGGRGRLDGDLDPELHSILAAALDTLIDELVASTPRSELPPMSQLRAEALDEICRRHLDSPATPKDHGNRPHMTVFADWNLLTGADRGGLAELGDGTVISPETARRLACDAIVCRLLTGPNSEILDLGRSRRSASPAQWRALRARDRHCRFPHCKRPWSWTDAHHFPHWVDDGPTDLDHLILLCRHHHTLFHEGGWTIDGTAEHPIFIRPDGTPLNNGPP